MKEQLESFLQQIQRLGGEASPLVFAPPASEEEVQKVELQLDYRIPEDFRKIILTLCSKCDFKWSLPDNYILPLGLEEIFAGELRWDIKLILEFNQSQEGWIKEVFSNPDDEYDRVWYNKLLFQDVGNGDFIAIDLLPETYGQIVYLSHDDGEGHGYVMADTFSALLDNWVKVGCTGGEDWQWLPFCKDKFSGINPNSSNALLWRQTIEGV